MKRLHRKWRLQSHQTQTNGVANAPLPMIMTTAFSMIELIFIIIILGILGSMMKMNMPDNRLLSDTNFIVQKIKAKQIYALSYDNFDYTTNKFFDDTTCIFINKETINNNEKDSAKASPYKINPKTTITPNDLNICFDNLGRPFKLNNLEEMPIVFNIAYKDSNKTINIMPFSGSIVRE